jgi:hypothetical protein
MSDHLPKDPDESYRAGADILGAADKAWRTNGAAPDPFQPPERFRDTEHRRQWVVALSKAIVSKETALRGLKAWNDTIDHRRKLGPTREDRQIFVKAFGRFLQVKSDGYSLDDFVLYLPTRSYIFKPLRQMWPAASVNKVVPPVQNGVDKDGNPKYISASAWLDQDKDSQVLQMTWAPGKPEMIRDKIIDSEWIDRPGCTIFNSYRPPTIVPKTGPVDLWRGHLRRIYPGEAEHIMRWLAHRVQRPHEKINHALVLGGAQGIGKDTILEPVKRAVGPWNFEEVSPQNMLGRFNGFAKSVILRVSEARDLGDLGRFAFYDHMKAYTAAPPDVLRVDEKHLQEYPIPNVTGVIITTNHKTNGIFLPEDDRRHFVAWSEATKDDFTAGYWNKLWGWYENDGGHEAVAAYLQNFPLSDFDPKAPPPKTVGFWQIVDASRAPEDADLRDALEALGSPEVTTLDHIADKASADFALWLRDKRNSARIPHRLEECGYVRVRNEATTDGRWKVRGKNVVLYARAELSERDRVAAARRSVGW